MEIAQTFFRNWYISLKIPFGLRRFLSYQFHTLIRSYSLNKMDVIIQKNYLNYKNGFFIEVGGADGRTQSNTLLLEKYHYWTGLLIEPMPLLYKQCQKNRPNCIVENAALVSFDYLDSQIKIHYNYLMSQVEGSKGYNPVAESEIPSVMVPARTLSSILDQHAIEKIDFLSLDVEGYELNVLQGIDFERHKPAYILIEIWENMDSQRKNEINDLLSLHYELVAKISSHDYLYKAK